MQISFDLSDLSKGHALLLINILQAHAGVTGAEVLAVPALRELGDKAPAPVALPPLTPTPETSGNAAPSGAGVALPPIVPEGSAASSGGPALPPLNAAENPGTGALSGNAGTASPAAAGVDKDSTGLPWDARIHAANKGTNKDGSWRAKRNVDEAEVVKVSAELRALAALPSPTGAASTQGTAAPKLDTPVTPVSASPTTPVELVTKVAHLTGVSKLLTAGELAQALGTVGLTDISQVFNRPDFVPAINAEIEAILAS